MTDQELGRVMYARALNFLKLRYPAGWGGCAVMYTEEGRFLTSVYLDSPNAAAGLCMETGAMCEAQKYHLNITHTLCMSRNSESEQPQVLTPCGICQERLRYWGGGVKAAVAYEDEEVIFKTIEELSPHYWAEAFPPEQREHYEPGIVLPMEDV